MKKWLYLAGFCIISLAIIAISGYMLSPHHSPAETAGESVDSSHAGGASVDDTGSMNDGGPAALPDSGQPSSRVTHGISGGMVNEPPYTPPGRPSRYDPSRRPGQDRVVEAPHPDGIPANGDQPPESLDEPPSIAPPEDIPPQEEQIPDPAFPDDHPGE